MSYSVSCRGPRDFTQNFTNIDNLCQVLSTVQAEKGVEQLFELRDEYKVNAPVIKPKTQKPKQQKQYKYSWQCLADRDYLYDDNDDDEEDFFICDYCEKLGHLKKYDPVMCDSCHVCLTCTEYNNDECDGCTYSCHRDGTFYRDKVPESEIISERDISLFNQAKEHDCKCRLERKTFSVL